MDPVGWIGGRISGLAALYREIATGLMALAMTVVFGGWYRWTEQIYHRKVSGGALPLPKPAGTALPVGF